MKYKINNKEINIPNEEIKNLMTRLDLTEAEAIQTWLDDNDYTINTEVEELTKKAKVNGTTKIKAREHVGNKKVERERKANPTKALIIEELNKTLASVQGISNLRIENKEKLITFTLNEKNYKLDLIQRRA